MAIQLHRMQCGEVISHVQRGPEPHDMQHTSRRNMDTISCQDCCAAQCSPDTVHVEKAQKWWAQLKLHHMVLRAISDRELFCRIQCQKMICALLENAARWIKVNQGESRWIKVNQGESRWIKVNQGESRWIKVNQGESRWTTIYNRARAFPSASGPKWKALPPSQSAARLGDPLPSFRAHRLNGLKGHCWVVLKI